MAACAHSRCTCPETTVTNAGKNYCSSACQAAAAASPATTGCPCGHPDCRGDAL